MTKMPKAAQVIAKVIRAKVKKPKLLPNKWGHPGSPMRFQRIKGRYCPMGLLPGAKSATPLLSESFNKPPGTQAQINAFWRWWDSQTNPRQAVDAVWGK